MFCLIMTACIWQLCCWVLGPSPVLRHMPACTSPSLPACSACWLSKSRFFVCGTLKCLRAESCLPPTLRPSLHRDYDVSRHLPGSSSGPPLVQVPLRPHHVTGELGKVFSCPHYLFSRPDIDSGLAWVTGLFGSYLSLAEGNPHRVIFRVPHAKFAQTSFSCHSDSLLASISAAAMVVLLVPATTLPSLTGTHFFLIQYWLQAGQSCFYPTFKLFSRFFPSGLSSPVDTPFHVLLDTMDATENGMDPPIPLRPSGTKSTFACPLLWLKWWVSFWLSQKFTICGPLRQLLDGSSSGSVVLSFYY